MISFFFLLSRINILLAEAVIYRESLEKRIDGCGALVCYQRSNGVTMKFCKVILMALMLKLYLVQACKDNLW